MATLLQALTKPPTAFNDSISARAKQLRFRGVGNPYAFLDEIGIIAIKERIYKGAMLIDIAEELNLPLSTIKKWIDNNSLEGEIEEASVSSAEGYIQKGEKLLAAAETNFDLNKAKAMIEHGRFMASKKDKKQFGNQVEITGGPASVHYSFILPEVPPAFLDAKPAAIEGEFKELEQVSLQMSLEDKPVEASLLDPLEKVTLGREMPEKIDSGVAPVEPIDE